MLDFILRQVIEVERGALLAILITYVMVFFLTSGEKARRRESKLRFLSGATMILMAIELIADCATWWPGFVTLMENPYAKATAMRAELIIVPLAYLTITEITLRRKVTPALATYHCLPFIVMLITGLIVHNIWFEYIYFALLIPYVCICFMMFVRAIRQYEQRISDAYSDHYGLSTKWMRYILISLAAIFFIYAAHMQHPSQWSKTLLFAIEICLWCIVGHKIYQMIKIRENALRPIQHLLNAENGEEEPEMPQTAEDTANQRAADIVATKETFTAQLTPTQRQELEQFSKRLQTICEEGKLYKKEDLTRDELANEMGLNHTYFTRMLKAARGLSFYDYINTLRMEDAAELLKDPQFPLDSIPYEIGYRHKSTYYRAFSEHFGCTPKEYRKKIN